MLKTIVYSLAVVARPAAAWSGAPTIAREARRADSRHPGRKRGKLSLLASDRTLAYLLSEPKN